MAEHHLDPARKVLDKLGGFRSVAAALGVDATCPYRWMVPKDRGGTGGKIPGWHHDALFDLADKLGVELTPNDFFSRRKPSRRGNGEARAA